MPAKQQPIRNGARPGAPQAGSLRQKLAPIATVGLGVLLLAQLSPRFLAANDAELSQLKRQVVTNYAALAFAAYQDSMLMARKLDSAIASLLTDPSANSLAAARRAWLEARVPYSQTEVCRFYDGPIDQIETKVNSWPIDENYIDYVAGNPNAGIINDPVKFPVLSRQLIVSLNEKEGKKNISTGFHAIEFLLWGQGTGATEPGNRPWTDYAQDRQSAARRRQYLKIVSALLVEHLQSITDAWAEGNEHNYRQQFLALDTDTALADILKGMGSLSGPELSGERLTVPYETKEKKEEQDCFSDNTRNDLVDDALGIQNVYLGHYREITGREVRGAGIRDLLTRLDPAFSGKLTAQIESAVACARAIPDSLGQAVQGKDDSPGRVAVRNAMLAFQTQSDMIAQAAKVLSVKLNL
jgi:putative iron-regulated protein